jgi:methyl-accepting chemotaxis protein
MSIKRFFQIIGSVVFLFIVGSGIFLFSLSSKVKNEIDVAIEHVIPSLLDFYDLKDGVVQIQQFATDAALTHNVENMKVLEKYYLTAKDILHKLENIHKNSNPKVYKELLEFEKNLDMFYKLSLKMVNEYLKGNNALSVMEKVDEYAQKLNEFLDRYIKKHEDKLVNILKKVDIEVYNTSIIITVLFIILLVLIGAAMLYIYNRLIKSFNELNKNILNIVKGEGDLTKRIEISSNDEIAEVARNMNLLIEKLQETVSQTKDLSMKNANTATKLAQNSLEVEKRIIKESNDIKEIDTSLKTILEKVENSKNFALSTKEDILQTQEELELAKEQIDVLT